MKQFIPFLLISLLLFVTMKAINHLYKEEKKHEPDKITPRTFSYPVQIKDSMILYRNDTVYKIALQNTSLPRAKPSDFKSYYFFNCKLIQSSSNGLCFYPGGIHLKEESHPRFDETWKHQFIQFI